uniref:Uncharacterized protein n=1 Tax=Arundo donax TaxID=35708 RepID=A0A0A9FEF2_ARUDO
MTNLNNHSLLRCRWLEFK